LGKGFYLGNVDYLAQFSISRRHVKPLAESTRVVELVHRLQDATHEQRIFENAESNAITCNRSRVQKNGCVMPSKRLSRLVLGLWW
jgi:hypothetical protein